MDNYKVLLGKIEELNNRMGWTENQDLKQTCIAANVEAGELLENFLWDTEPDLEEVKKEIADVYIYLIHMCNSMDVDINDIAIDKMNYNLIRFQK